MAHRTLPPFRADHVGGLLRPELLLRAREQHATGEIDAERLREVEDDAIREVVRLRKELGFHTATDGEYRRASWHMDFIHQLGGISRAQDELTVTFHNEEGDIEFTPSGLRVTDPVRFEHPIFGEDFAFPKEAVRNTSQGGAEDLTPKLTIPSPAWSTTGAEGPPSIPRSTPTRNSSGPISRPPTRHRSVRWPSSATPTCSWTTPAWPTSTTRPSAA